MMHGMQITGIHLLMAKTTTTAPMVTATVEGLLCCVPKCSKYLRVANYVRSTLHAGVNLTRSVDVKDAIWSSSGSSWFCNMKQTVFWVTKGHKLRKWHRLLEHLKG